MVLSDLIIRACWRQSYEAPTRLRNRRGIKSYPTPPLSVSKVLSALVVCRIQKERMLHCKGFKKSNLGRNVTWQVAQCAGGTGTCGLGTSIAP